MSFWFAFFAASLSAPTAVLGLVTSDPLTGIQGAAIWLVAMAVMFRGGRK